ncbi:hypothetical protein DRP05_13215 [Archaeoglobales archaeon]|nr:MAG: hypothetical protein DRP05_13215 [Archaeoglobales archaeon]
MGDLVTGLFMGVFSGKMVVLPALILLIPPSIGLRGNIYASLGSRLSSYLHTGRITPKLEFDPKIADNIYSSSFLLLVFSMFSGFVAAKIAILMGWASSFWEIAFDLTLISALSGFLSIIFMLPSTLVLSIGSYKWGWDPDNLTAPIITLFGDLLTLPLIFLCVDVVFAVTYVVKVALIVFLVFFAVVMFILSIKSKEEIAKRITKESVPILTFCAILQFGAGTILGVEVESLITITGLLTIIPAFLEDGGAMGGILSARFSTMLHLGSLKPTLKIDNKVFSHFISMHLLGMIIFAMVGLFGQMVNFVLNLPTIPTLEMVIVTVVAGQLLVVLLNFLSYYFSIVSFKKGFDPDNVGIPMITSFMDILGSFCLILVLKLFGII